MSELSFDQMAAVEGGRCDGLAFTAGVALGCGMVGAAAVLAVASLVVDC
jgi:hypothetical protein